MSFSKVQIFHLYILLKVKVKYLLQEGPPEYELSKIKLQQYK